MKVLSNPVYVTYKKYRFIIIMLFVYDRSLCEDYIFDRHRWWRWLGDHWKGGDR